MEKIISPYDEQELLLRVAKGDEKAFSRIVEKYASLISMHMAVRVKDSMKAEEVKQDVLMSIWNYRDKLPEMQNFPGFVYIVTRNKVKSQLKKKDIPMPEITEERIQESIAVSDPSMEVKELKTILYRAIEMLPQKRKEVFKLSRLEGLNNDEIAARLKLSRNTIREHIREALLFLRGCIPQCFMYHDYSRQRKTIQEVQLVA
ncbi:MAG: sigma-70 family RNA polymerase sigma factor [Chitinophagaceae bacterium]|nr:sigma-70 family RNA polymerase sigma factor [Chitinophagaceae bacterium]